MTFAEKIKFVRGRLQLSQIQLAKELGVSNVTINRWEMKGLQPSFLSEKNSRCFANSKALNSKSKRSIA